MFQIGDVPSNVTGFQSTGDKDTVAICSNVVYTNINGDTASYAVSLARTPFADGKYEVML